MSQKPFLTICGGTDTISRFNSPSPTRRGRSWKTAPFEDLTSDERAWLSLATASLNRIHAARRAGRPRNQAFCIFEVDYDFVQFLAWSNSESLACEIARLPSGPPIPNVQLTKIRCSLLRLGFIPPGISPNYSKELQITSVDDLTDAAQLGLHLLKDIYQVSDFSSAIFKENIPAGR
jgi:hypothetical protein